MGNMASEAFVTLESKRKIYMNLTFTHAKGEEILGEMRRKINEKLF